MLVCVFVLLMKYVFQLSSFLCSQSFQLSSPMWYSGATNDPRMPGHNFLLSRCVNAGIRVTFQFLMSSLRRVLLSAILLYNPEYGVRTLHRNVCKFLSVYTASHEMILFKVILLYSTESSNVHSRRLGLCCQHGGLFVDILVGLP
jgi:hypothetical protein